MERETAKRVWAAGGYANLTPPKLAKKLGVSVDTLKRTVRGERGMRAFESEEEFLRKVAEVCDLPREFFDVDFNQLPLLLAGDQQRALVLSRIGGYGEGLDRAVYAFTATLKEAGVERDLIHLAAERALTKGWVEKRLEQVAKDLEGDADLDAFDPDDPEPQQDEQDADADENP